MSPTRHKNAIVLTARALIMLLISLVYIVIVGKDYRTEHAFYGAPLSLDTLRIGFEEGSECVSLKDLSVDGNTLSFSVHALSEGKAVFFVTDDSGVFSVYTFYVHRLGFITENSRLGNCTGGNIIIIMLTVYAAVVLAVFIRKFLKGLKEDYYSYHNITLLAMIVLVATVIASNVFFAFDRNGLLDFIRGVLNATALSFFAIPAAMLITLGVLISNIVLMVKEGANKRNILGTVFSFAYLLFLIFPVFFEGFMQMQEVIDVHRETGFGHFLELIVVNFCYCVTAYMTAILIATVIMGIKSARRIPAFDKDHILILGCGIRKDGSLTPLLKGRADAAIRFAEMQKKATGRDVVFVPSGGQGSDEIISEAEAIRNYLNSCGIGDDMIVTEDKSGNTAENFSFSVARIKEASGIHDPGIAFATTGYHVFRSGYIAARQGIHAEGIGSKTRAYFWINAFIREMIATLYYERKKHALVVATLFLAVTVMGSILFLSYLI